MTQTVHRKTPVAPATEGDVEETRDFTYDLAGNVLTLSDISGHTAYVYDDLYRVVTETRTNGTEAPYTVASEYDLAGNRVEVHYPGGKSLASVYDAMNRLKSVTEAGETEGTTYEYDHNGNRESCEYPNGTVNTYT